MIDTQWLLANEGSRARPSRYVWILVALMAALWAADLAQIWSVTNHHDLEVFLRAALRIRASFSGDEAGMGIFADAPAFQKDLEEGSFRLQDDTVVWPYAYPPLIAMLFVPATFLPETAVQILWWLCNVCCLCLGCWLTLRAVWAATSLNIGLVLLLLYRFQPARFALRIGQIELVQFLLLAATLNALSRDRERLAGVMLGLATGIKFFPGALIAFLLWRRRWRSAVWALATATVTIGGPFAIVGFDQIPLYMQYMGIYGVGGVFASFPFNQSFNGFFSRNLIHNVFAPTLKGWHAPAIAIGLTLACDALAISGCAWLTWHSADEHPDSSQQVRHRFGLEFALAIVTLLLVSPHSQIYAYVWTLIALIPLAVWLASQPRMQWGLWAVLCTAYLLMARRITTRWILPARLVSAHPLFGLMLLWATIGLVLLRLRSRAHSPVSGRPNTCIEESAIAA